MPPAGWIRVVSFALFLSLAFTTSSNAQNGGGSKSGTDISVVPSVIRYSGQLLSPAGQPLTGTVSLTFGVYTDPDTKNALWLEVQSVEVDAAGRYVVYLGAMTAGGLPPSIFTAGEARWIGAQALGAQEVRSPLLSVPYAMKAADAETLGGRPASDYLTIYDTKNGGGG